MTREEIDGNIIVQFKGNERRLKDIKCPICGETLKVDRFNNNDDQNFRKHNIPFWESYTVESREIEMSCPNMCVRGLTITAENIKFISRTKFGII